MLGRQFCPPCDERFLYVFLFSAFLQNLHEDGVIYSFRDAQLPDVKAYILGSIYKVVSDDLADLVLLCCQRAVDENLPYAGVLNGPGGSAVDLCILFHEDLSRRGICHIRGGDQSGQAVGQPQLFVVFVSTDLGQIVSSRIEKQGI